MYWGHSFLELCHSLWPQSTKDQSYSFYNCECYGSHCFESLWFWNLSAYILLRMLETECAYMCGFYCSLCCKKIVALWPWRQKWIFSSFLRITVWVWLPWWRGSHEYSFWLTNGYLSCCHRPGRRPVLEGLSCHLITPIKVPSSWWHLDLIIPKALTPNLTTLGLRILTYSSVQDTVPSTAQVLKYTHGECGMVHDGHHDWHMLQVRKWGMEIPYCNSEFTKEDLDPYHHRIKV